MGIFSSPSKKVHNVFKSYSLLRDCICLRDVGIPVKNGEVLIENILIGGFGIIICNSCDIVGQLYGSVKEEKMIVNTKKGDTYLRKAYKNPVLDITSAISGLRDIFAKNKIYKVNIEGFVVFTRSAKKQEILFDDRKHTIFLSKLKSMLTLDKYEYGGTVDYKKIAELLQSSEI